MVITAIKEISLQPYPQREGRSGRYLFNGRWVVLNLDPQSSTQFNNESLWGGCAKFYLLRVSNENEMVIIMTGIN